MQDAPLRWNDGIQRPIGSVSIRGKHREYIYILGAHQMDMSLPLNKMTTIEKLRAIEEIWEDLLRDSESVLSPAWHAVVLLARKQRVREGASQFSDWDKAKSRIRKKI